MTPALNLANYCDACQAIPRHGYCKLAGCPKARPQPSGVQDGGGKTPAHSVGTKDGTSEVTPKSALKEAVERVTDDLIERLCPEPGCCAFCGCDPYHYVDNGVGMERVAVTCCDEGVALYQYGDEVLTRQVGLRLEAADEIERLKATLSSQSATLEAMASALTVVRCMAENAAYNLHQMGISQETASPARAFEDIERQARTTLTQYRQGDLS